MTAATPGWYAQPDGRQRFWDGLRWTEHYAAGARGLEEPVAPFAAQRPAASPLPAVPSLPATVAILPRRTAAAPARAATTARSVTAARRSALVPGAVGTGLRALLRRVQAR